MFLIRPRRQRRQRQLQVSKQIEVGDKVLLSSGIIGRVDGFVGDHARIEVAPGVIISCAGRYPGAWTRQSMAVTIPVMAKARIGHSAEVPGAQGPRRAGRPEDQGGKGRPGRSWAGTRG